MPSAAEDQFFQGVLKDLSLPATIQNVDFLEAWASAEGTSAQNNPLATTQREPGSTTFNSVGVQNYATPATGEEATAQTISNGLYAGITAALRSGNAIQASFGNASVYRDLNTWAYGPNAGQGSTVTSYVRNVITNAQGAPPNSGNISAATPGLFGSGTLEGAPQTLYQGSGAKTVVDTVLGPIDSVEKLISFLTSWRFAEIIGGVILLIIGLVLLGKQFTGPVAGAATSVAKVVPGL